MISRLALHALALIGVDPAKAARTLRGIPRYAINAVQYSARQDGRFRLRPGVHYPLFDAGDSAGSAGGHYFHQDLWAARKIFEQKPARHVDVGSRIDGFVAHVLTFMPVEVIDLRDLQSHVPGLVFVREDATLMTRFLDNTLESLSSLHAVEHFGLGRYGDSIDPSAWRTAMQSMARVLAPDGRLYFSVPIGRERVVFNAHRIFDPRTVVMTFDSLDLVSFSAVDDDGDLIVDPNMADCRAFRFGCGLFEFTKSRRT